MREELARAAAARVTIPLIFLLPIMVIAAAWSVRRGLLPLRHVTAEVQRRDVRSLEPLGEKNLPREIEPLVRELNRLLARLREAFGDAAVNPGNSGGPLFVKTGKVVHSRLGVEVQTLNQSLADSFKMKAPNGALVAKVAPDSAAAQAGLKVGDVILEFNGTPIFDAGQLSARVGVTAPGEKASLEIWRDGKTLSLTATIGSAAQVASEGGSADESAPAHPVMWSCPSMACQCKVWRSCARWCRNTTSRSRFSFSVAKVVSSSR